MRIQVKDEETQNSIIFKEIGFKEFLALFDLCKKEKYTMVIEPVDQWD